MLALNWADARPLQRLTTGLLGCAVVATVVVGTGLLHPGADDRDAVEVSSADRRAPRVAAGPSTTITPVVGVPSSAPSTQEPGTPTTGLEPTTTTGLARVEPPSAAPTTAAVSSSQGSRPVGTPSTVAAAVLVAPSIPEPTVDTVPASVVTTPPAPDDEAGPGSRGKGGEHSGKSGRAVDPPKDRGKPGG